MYRKVAENGSGTGFACFLHNKCYTEIDLVVGGEPPPLFVLWDAKRAGERRFEYMAEVKNVADIVEKWTRVTPNRRADFERGVAAPRRSWEQSTSAAESRYNEGVQTAITEGRFGRGVTAAGDSKWKRKVSTVGVQRWGPGVQAAAQDYQKGFAPYQAAIESVSLPPRYPAGDPRNFDRVRAIGEALHAKKVSG